MPFFKQVKAAAFNPSPCLPIISLFFLLSSYFLPPNKRSADSIEPLFHTVNSL